MISLRLTLVEEAAYWHKLWSIRMAIITAVLGTVSVGYQMMPFTWQEAMPHWLPLSLGYATVASAATTGASRVIKQQLAASAPPVTVTTPAPLPKELPK